MTSQALPKRWLAGITALPASLRHPQAHAAFKATVLDQPEGAFCLSIGGGPSLVHSRLRNLNLLPFANVHVVGTAYALPFVSSSIHAIYCEAVLEHLERPELAVAEMHRVLRLGGQLFASTPFLQPYHGYPDHFQNFTLNGHVRLFERAGFHVAAAGACVGPVFALVDHLSNFWRECLPTRLLSRGAYYLTRLVASPCLLVDRFLLRRSNSHMLASSTFVHCFKPQDTQLAA